MTDTVSQSAEQKPDKAAETKSAPSFPDTFPALTKALEAQGYTTPTQVQQAIFDPALQGKDLLVSARTGSGKTVAFGMAFAQDLLGDEKKLPKASAPLALVVAPTRELAQQVQRELEWLYADAGAEIACCIGGTDARREARTLERGAHIVVGTPGRLCDHLSRRNLKLSKVRVAVLDEADEMLDMGFREELEKLLDSLPEQHRTLLFSATIAKEIVTLAKRFQKDSVRIDVASNQKQHADIEYRAVVTPPKELEASLVNVLRYYECPTAMVFCNTRMMVKEVQTYLMDRGFSSVAISGEMGQNERSRAIESLRSGHARVCVATDVAARGIDIRALELVVHVTLPGSSESLLHRSGRTGRAGRKGTSVLLVPVNQRRRAERLLNQAQIKAEWEAVPTISMITERDGQKLMDNTLLKQAAKAEVEGLENTGDQALISKLVETYDAKQLAAALVEFYLAGLPAPENIAPVSPTGPSPRSMKGAWFRMGLGRKEGADPKWLVPLICKLGNVQKRDIGDIRILPDHTLFQIADARVQQFTLETAGAGNDQPSIEPSAPPPQDAGFSRDRRGRGGKPSGGPRKGGKGGGKGGFGKGGGKPFAGRSESRKRTKK
ncbi:atp-dependent rna helicase [Lasius niger]|uniref:Atp-dependent rna helicase n=1 Tax=Lasius niger TaxID=67767 RepID=A0A0J7KHW8_LASNI|nr:atp-dependent rna helicase [Lasius niger]